MCAGSMWRFSPLPLRTRPLPANDSSFWRATPLYGSYGFDPACEGPW